ncbi:MAG TPA: cistern family PEP-CTERM protein, partial [Arenibaculum sp.]|nr:cistern family PEP-CTERM protein [Arenibaculum sp.]
ATFQSAIRSIGFDVAPNSDVSFSGSGDVFNRIATNTTFPDYKKIDICVFAGNNNCAGGPIDNGLQSGETDSFLLKFVGNYTNGLVLSQLPTRWQTAEGSYNFSPGSVVSLSEPSTITLVLTGLLLMMAVLHRRRLVQAVARVRSPLRGPSAHARPLCGQA